MFGWFFVGPRSCEKRKGEVQLRKLEVVVWAFSWSKTYQHVVRKVYVVSFGNLGKTHSPPSPPPAPFRTGASGKQGVSTEHFVFCSFTEKKSLNKLDTYRPPPCKLNQPQETQTKHRLTQFLENQSSSNRFIV